MKRMERINEQLRSELSNLIEQKLDWDKGLITIVRVKCSPDLSQATINISVLPENVSGTALRKLRSQNQEFAQILGKKLNLKRIPRFHWKIDWTERRAAEINKILEQIRNDKNETSS